MEVTLSNVPRADLLPPNANRGPHVYPFFDPALQPKYDRLIKPSEDHAVDEETLAALAHTAPPSDVIARSWFGEELSAFETGHRAIPRWPFARTTIIDASLETAPTDEGLLDADDLGADIAEVFAGRPDPPPTHPPNSAGVLRPTISEIRARKFRLEVPADIRAALRRWQQMAITIKNEAIRLVNQASHLAHPNLSVFNLYELLANELSEFVVHHQLRGCPSPVRRHAVDEIVAARRAILRRHKNNPRIPIHDIRPVTFDPKKSFSWGFTRDSGHILPRPYVPNNLDNNTEVNRQANPVLRFAPTKLKQQNVVTPEAQIRLRGQKARRWLIDHCSRTHQAHLQYRLPREWLIHLDRYGRYNLVLLYKVPTQSQASTTILDGNNLVVRSGDPGGHTAWTIYSGDGTVRQLGGPQARQRLRELREDADDYQSEIMRRSDPNDDGATASRQLNLPPDARTHQSNGRILNRRRTRSTATTNDNNDNNVGERRQRHRRSARPRSRRQQRAAESSQSRQTIAVDTINNDVPPPRNSSGGTVADSRADTSLPFALNARKRRRLWLKKRRVEERHHQLLTDFHRRLVNWLASTSDVVILPRMEVRAMIRRRYSTLRRVTKRDMLGWAPCALLNRLLVKCHDVVFDDRYPDKTRPTVVLVQPEAYTSKTCPQCGSLHPSLGSSRIFNCPACHYRSDRDHNGAFNMIIKVIR